jgi:hypothetical protein
MARTKSCVKVLVKNIHEDLRSLFDKKRLCEFLHGDPNAPYGGLGPPIPTSPRVKT